MPDDVGEIAFPCTMTLVAQLSCHVQPAAAGALSSIYCAYLFPIITSNSRFIPCLCAQKSYHGTLTRKHKAFPTPKLGNLQLRHRRAHYAVCSHTVTAASCPLL